MKFVAINQMKLDLLLQHDVLNKHISGNSTVYLIDTDFGTVVAVESVQEIKMLPVHKDKAELTFDVVCDFV